MASSGTVGQTSLDLAKVIEKVYRRCGIPTGAITPELVDIAKENLFLMFQNWSNRGINLWCVDKPLVGINSHTATYAMPVGTIDVLNAAYRQNTLVTPDTETYGASTIDLDFGDTQTLMQFGIKPSAAYTDVSFTFSGSDNGVAFTVYKTVTLADLASGTNYWYSLDPSGQHRYWRLTITTAQDPANMDLKLVSTFTDLVIARLNRDDYEALPNKRYEGNPCLQYWFNRQMTPTLTLWPVPSLENDCLTLVTHRQVQDVGNDLTATLEVPDRWMDAFLWNVTAMCAVEVPQLPSDRLQLVLQQADAASNNAEMEERDTAPIYLAPNLSVYTR